MDRILFTIASAHHRMAWTHPFEDGNGRAVRLQTHCALLPISAGLWSANRGLARNRDQYYAMLAGADAPRQGDLDGRGNLSERQLWAWCKWFAELCEDQVNFMSAMMDLHTLRDRIAAYVVVKGRAEGIKEYREECILALQTVATSGAVSRGDFVRMTGLGERTGRAALSRFLKDGLLRPAGDAQHHRSYVGIGFPISSLNVLFPNLYPEAATAVID
jgi:Fic family protein